MKLLVAGKYLLKINFLLVILFCTSKSFARKSDYSLLDKPMTINYSVGNKNFQLKTYLANKQQRAHTLYLRIINKVYENRFLKYGIILTQNEKNKITELFLESHPHYKKLYRKLLKSEAILYEEIYKISLFMQKKSLNPNNAYALYIKTHNFKLSKRQWEKLFSISSLEWLQNFTKASEQEKINILAKYGAVFPLQVLFLYETTLAACQQNKIQAEKKWNKEINDLVIQVPNEYLAVRKKVQQKLKNSFRQMVKIPIDSKLKLPYEELKKYINKHNKQGNK